MSTCLARRRLFAEDANFGVSRTRRGGGLWLGLAALRSAHRAAQEAKRNLTPKQIFAPTGGTSTVAGGPPPVQTRTGADRTPVGRPIRERCGVQFAHCSPTRPPCSGFHTACIRSSQNTPCAAADGPVCSAVHTPQIAFHTPRTAGDPRAAPQTAACVKIRCAFGRS